MKVLICSYSPCGHTSYGSITRELWTRLEKTKQFDILQHAWFHDTAIFSVPWKITPVTKGDSKDMYGEKSIEKVISSFQPDIVWCLSDLYMSTYLDKLKKKFKFKLVRWTLSEGDPIDEVNVPSLKASDECVAITKYTSQLWEELTGKTYKTIYHGVDTDIFKPVILEEKLAFRAKYSQGMMSPEDFVISFIGRNQQRKRPWLIFEVAHYLLYGHWGWDKDMRPVLNDWNPVLRRSTVNPAIVTQAKPIPVKVWMHSFDDGRGWNFEKLAKQWALYKCMTYTNGLSDKHGLPTDDMATIYQISDAVHMVSGSEGFGVPLIEAAACGIPSVYTDYSGCGEIGSICQGYPVKPLSYEPAKFSHVRWANPNVAEAVAAYYKIYENRNYWNKPEVKVKLYNHINSIFNYDDIALQWLDVLNEVNEREPVVMYGESI